MRFQEHSSSGTRHCLICNDGFIGGGRNGEESQVEPSSRFPLTGEDVQVLDKLFQLELEEKEKEGLTGFGIRPSSLSLTSSTTFMTSTSSYCVSCSFKVGILSQLWADLEGIQIKISQIRTEFLRNIERTLPQIPPGSSAHAIKLKVLEKTSRTQVVVDDPTPGPMTCSKITPETGPAASRNGEGTVLNQNALIPISGELVEIPGGSNNIIEALNQSVSQDEAVTQLMPSLARFDVKDDVQSRSQLFPNPTLIRTADELEPPSLIREDPILDYIIIEDSDDGQVESSLEEHDLSQQTVQGSKIETVPSFDVEGHEETANYTEMNASSLLMCPEVEQCGSEGFKHLRLLSSHFAKKHSTSKIDKIFYKGQVKPLAFKCKVCPPPKCFARQFQLDKHMSNVHKHIITRRSHLRRPEGKKCGSKKLRSLKLLRNHSAKEHLRYENEKVKVKVSHKGQVECKVCLPSKSFSRKHQLDRHMRNVHELKVTGRSIFTCPEIKNCRSETFYSLELLRRHFAKKHSESTRTDIFYNGQLRSLIFKCTVCSDPKCFARHRDLNRHMHSTHKVTLPTIEHRSFLLSCPAVERCASEGFNELDHNLSRPSANTQQPSERRQGLRRKRAVNYAALFDSGGIDTMDNDDDIDSIKPQHAIIVSKDNSEDWAVGTSQHTPRNSNPTPRPVKMTELSNVPESENESKQIVLSKPIGRPKSAGKPKSLISLNSSQRSTAQLKRKLDPMNCVTQNGVNPNPVDPVHNIRNTDKFQFMIPILKLHRLQLP